MTVELGDYIYTQQTSGLDTLGVSWIYAERRTVLAIDGDTVTLSARSDAEFPTHSAPALEDIAWLAASPAFSTTVPMAMLGATGSQYLTSLTLPDPEVIDEDAVRSAWLAHTNHKFTNRELGKAPPTPTDATQAYQFHVLEWRDGLPSPSAG